MVKQKGSLKSETTSQKSKKQRIRDNKSSQRVENYGSEKEDGGSLNLCNFLSSMIEIAAQDTGGKSFKNTDLMT